MERDLAILVPVLNRPHRVEPLLRSAVTATPNARLVFICDRNDLAEQRAIARIVKRHSFGSLTVDTLVHSGNYAAKINAAARKTREPLLFLGADDIDFHAGWFEKAYGHIDGPTEVVGVNDLIDRRTLRKGHATHFLITRSYAELPTIDGNPGPLFEGYAHNFCDDEFISTAKRRGAYVYAEDAHVRHHHPMSGGSDDATYRKGRGSFHHDKVIYRSRTRLWA